jgi:large subunit ribosomal protein L10
LNRQEKEQVVADVAATLAASRAVFITDFKGLKMGEISGLRRKVAEAGGQYQVVKNTLLTLAGRSTMAEEITTDLAGNNALGTTTGDVVALAKALVDFAKENEKLVIKSGALLGRYLDPAEIKRLAGLPGRDVLLAQLFGTLNGVPAGFVRLLGGVMQKFLYTLAAVRDHKETAGT